jgi:diketogulonate reductase-like aldo/keto reductase
MARSVIEKDLVHAYLYIYSRSYHPDHHDIMTSSLPTVALRGGKQLPILAFGVGTALFKKDCSTSVNQALSAGFTFLDLAEVYANSQFVEPALSKQKREHVFVLDKIMSMKEIYKVAHEEIEKLKIKKFDALLLHSPPRGVDGNPSNVEAWKVMEQLKDEGVTE